MRIGLFSDLWEPDANGTAIYVRTLLDELRSAGHTVYVFAPAPADFDWSRGRNQETGVYRFHARYFPFNHELRVSFPLYSPLRDELSKLRLDVVHSFAPFSTGIFAIRVARKAGIPHVHTFATRWPEYARLYVPGPARMTAGLMQRCTTGFYNLTDEVIALTPVSRAELRRNGVRSPITVIPVGIPDDAFEAVGHREALRCRYGVPEGAPLVLTVGRLGHEKSFDFLLRAFARVLALVPNAHYLIHGHGPARSEFEQLASRLGIAHRVTFTGEIVDRSVVLGLYASADVFTFAGRVETGPLVLLEAAAAGLPLVARSDGPLEGKVVPGVNGVFRDDEAGFAEEVARLLLDPALAARFGRASIEVAGRHSASAGAHQQFAVYENAIERKRSEAAR